MCAIPSWPKPPPSLSWTPVDSEPVLLLLSAPPHTLFSTWSLDVILLISQIMSFMPLPPNKFPHLIQSRILVQMVIFSGPVLPTLTVLSLPPPPGFIFSSSLTHLQLCSFFTITQACLEIWLSQMVMWHTPNYLLASFLFSV